VWGAKNPTGVAGEIFNKFSSIIKFETTNYGLYRGTLSAKSDFSDFHIKKVTKSDQA